MQSQNRGTGFDFKFLFEHAGGRYFMWAADDDYFESSDLVEQLLQEARSSTLVFPDFNLSLSTNRSPHSVYQEVYGKCKDRYDYLFA